MKSETRSKVLVPILTAVIGILGTLLVNQWGVFSKHQVDVKQLNEELFLKNRIEAYIKFMYEPTYEGRYRLILLGSSEVIKSMGDIYTKFCPPPGQCENTCQANQAFIKLYQAMRKDFQISRADPVSDRDIYRARYEINPDCF